jgi:hypothetical protein
MSFALSPQSLTAIRRNISSSVTDTFQMMFQMDIFSMPEFQQSEENKPICAFMELVHQDTRACITISITRMVVEHIGGLLAPGGAGSSPEVVQDIVCEVTNIVGNHLRSYLSDKLSAEFKISMPRPGSPPPTDPQPLFNLHFRIRENDAINLDFGYNTPDTIAV